MFASPMPVMLFWMAVEMAVHVWLIVTSDNELSRTTSGETEVSVHTTEPPTVVIAHFLKALPSTDPKNSEPDGNAKEATAEPISVGSTLPNTATSSTGIVLKDWKRGEDGSGGTELFEVELRTNLTRALATLTSGMEERYCSTI